MNNVKQTGGEKVEYSPLLESNDVQHWQPNGEKEMAVVYDVCVSALGTQRAELSRAA